MVLCQEMPEGITKMADPDQTKLPTFVECNSNGEIA